MHAARAPTKTFVAAVAVASNNKQNQTTLQRGSHTSTRAMGKCRHPIDETALLRFCRARVPGFPRACASLDVDQFAHGQSNPTYKILALTRRGDVGGTYVVRKKPAGTLLKSAHAVEREYAVMRALRTTNVPTPDALALCEDARVRANGPNAFQAFGAYSLLVSFFLCLILQSCKVSRKQMKLSLSLSFQADSYFEL